MRMRGTVAVLLFVCAAGSAQGETPGACFEIIAAQAGVQPPILIDKCSGRTWQLVRQRGTYRWTVLPRDGSAPAVSAAAAEAGKCFTFEGRKFCE
jgi:hypothetical protein